MGGDRGRICDQADLSLRSSIMKLGKTCKQIAPVIDIPGKTVIQKQI